MPELARVQSSNSEINPNILLTHMFNLMLVKLNMYMTFTTLISETENKLFFTESTKKTFLNEDSH